MTTYRITFEVNVEDEEALIDYANDRVNDCWRGDLKDLVSEDEDLVERALLEAILFSNENPSPDEYGIEFGGVAEITKKGGNDG